MLAFGLFLIFGFGILGVPAPHGHATIMCRTCHGALDPSKCTHVEKCMGGAVCMTEARIENGETRFWKACVDKHKCEEHNAPIVGKRERHHASVCYECCSTSECNRHEMCSRYLPTTTAATTTAAQTAAPTTMPLPACRDHEEDGVTCASIAHDGFCTSDLSFIVDIKVQKCPQYCGMCDDNGNFLPSTAGLSTTTTDDTPKPSTAAPAGTTAAPAMTTAASAVTTAAPAVATAAPAVTTAAPAVTTAVPVVATNNPFVTDMPATDAPTTALPCVDDESDGFKCAAFDTLNFCTDTSSVAYPLAIEKCPAHCGFCTPSGGD